METSGKTGSRKPMTRSAQAKKTAEETEQRQKERLFRPRRIIGRNDIPVDLGSGKVKVEDEPVEKKPRVEKLLLEMQNVAGVHKGPALNETEYVKVVVKDELDLPVESDQELSGGIGGVCDETGEKTEVMSFPEGERESKRDCDCCSEKCQEKIQRLEKRVKELQLLLKGTSRTVQCAGDATSEEVPSEIAPEEIERNGSLAEVNTDTESLAEPSSTSDPSGLNTSEKNSLKSGASSKDGYSTKEKLLNTTLSLDSEDLDEMRKLINLTVKNSPGQTDSSSSHLEPAKLIHCDKTSLRDSQQKRREHAKLIQGVLEKFGQTLTTFELQLWDLNCYCGFMQPCENTDRVTHWYKTLLRWLKLMPNLGKIALTFHVTGGSRGSKKEKGRCQPNFDFLRWMTFPRLPNLNAIRFQNWPERVLWQILKANDHITDLHLGNQTLYGCEFSLPFLKRLDWLVCSYHYGPTAYGYRYLPLKCIQAPLLKELTFACKGWTKESFQELLCPLETSENLEALNLTLHQGQQLDLIPRMERLRKLKVLPFYSYTKSFYEQVMRLVAKFPALEEFSFVCDGACTCDLDFEQCVCFQKPEAEYRKHLEDEWVDELWETGPILKKIEIKVREYQGGSNYREFVFIREDPPEPIIGS